MKGYHNYPSSRAPRKPDNLATVGNVEKIIKVIDLLTKKPASIRDITYELKFSESTVRVIIRNLCDTGEVKFSHWVTNGKQYAKAYMLAEQPATTKKNLLQRKNSPNKDRLTPLSYPPFNHREKVICYGVWGI